MWETAEITYEFTSDQTECFYEHLGGEKRGHFISLSAVENERTKAAAVPLRGPLPSSNNCFMQMRHAERAASQSEAELNRGRSEFRGSAFGAKNLLLLLLLMELRAGRTAAAHRVRFLIGGGGARDNKAVNLPETRGSPKTGL